MSESQASEERARDGLVGRVLNEYLDRRARGEAEPEEELLAKHPDLAEFLRGHLDMVRDLAPSESKIDDLIARGILAGPSDEQYAAELGPYKIRRWVGRGGMGIVLEAYEESLRRTVALKILKPDLAEDAVAVARFKREAQAAAALRHPNIVTVHAVGHHGKTHFLTMEFVEGPSLADVIRGDWCGGDLSPVEGPEDLPGEQCHTTGQSVRTRTAAGAHTAERPAGRPLPADVIRHVFGQLLAGLQAAHQAGLVHRDIKPSNILLDCRVHGWPTSSEVGAGLADKNRDPTSEDVGHPSVSAPRSPIANLTSSMVKVADFGLARTMSAQTQVTLAGSPLGTAEYMSPEQAEGETELDHRTDLYSAGVVLYELLTGRVPFRGDRPTAVIRRIIDEEPLDPRTINKGADPALASLALRLMAKRPEDRFESADEVIEALEAGEPVSVPARRSLGRRYAVATVCVLAILSAGAWLLGRSKAPATVPGSAATVEPVITKAWATPKEPDQVLHRIVWANYSDGRTKVTFHDFGPDAGCVSGVVRADARGDGDEIVVAGVSSPLEGGCVFAFDQGGAKLWPLDMSSDRRWPDCEPCARFGCDALAVANLDDVPGDELVVLANDVHEYAGRVSIVDLQTHSIVSTFWHMGRLNGLRILADYFGAGRPGLLVWGYSNKLDGFSDGLRAGERTYTKWDKVQVLMVLDPAKLDGLGPPPVHPSRFRELNPDLPTAIPRPGLPHAYAFLDLANTCAERYPSWSPRANSECDLRQVGRIRDVSVERWEPTDTSGPWLDLLIEALDQDETALVRGELIVNRNLDLAKVVGPRGATDPNVESFEYWREHWRPIIQNGEYLSAP